jgi:hypothetical protein
LLPSPSSQHHPIEEGDEIAIVTIFVTKPLKNVTTIIITFFCNKAIEKGDGSPRCLLFLFKHREEGNDSKLMLLSSLQHYHRKRGRRITFVFFFFATPP